MSGEARPAATWLVQHGHEHGIRFISGLELAERLGLREQATALALPERLLQDSLGTAPDVYGVAFGAYCIIQLWHSHPGAAALIHSFPDATRLRAVHSEYTRILREGHRSPPGDPTGPEASPFPEDLDLSIADRECDALPTCDLESGVGQE